MLNGRALVFGLCAILLFAVTQPQSSCAQEENDFNGMLNKGYVLFQTRRYAEAETVLRKILEIWQAEQDYARIIIKVRFLVVMSLVHQKKYKEAVEYIEEALKLHKFDVGDEEELRFWVGICYLNLEDGESAEKAFQDFLRLYPRSKRAIISQVKVASALFLQEKHKENARWLELLLPALTDRELNEPAFLLYFYSLTQIEEYDKALGLVKVFDPYARNFQQIAAFHLLAMDLGGRFFDKSDYSKALIALQRVWS